MKNLKSYEEYLVESMPTYAFDGNELKLGSSVVTLDGYSGIIVSKEISNGRVIFRDHTGVLHVCESRYTLPFESINEDLQWWEVTKGILAADLIRVGSTLIGGGLAAAAFLFPEWRKSVSNRLKSIKDTSELKAKAHEIADKFNNDAELAAMFDELKSYPYMSSMMPLGKTAKKEQDKNNTERSRLMRNIGKHVKGKLTPKEMQYFVEINKILKDKPLTDNGGKKVEEDLQQLADGVADPSGSNAESQLNRDPQRSVGTGTYTSTWTDPLPMTKGGWYTKDASSAGTIPTYVQ